MLRKFWLWLVGQSPTDLLLERLISQQAQAQVASTAMVGKLLGTIEGVSSASVEQSKVLETYLKLFQATGEPQRFVATPEEDREMEMAEAGFPKDASEQDQAKWVLDHMGSFE